MSCVICMTCTISKVWTIINPEDEIRIKGYWVLQNRRLGVKDLQYTTDLIATTPISIVTTATIATLEKQKSVIVPSYEIFTINLKYKLSALHLLRVNGFHFFLIHDLYIQDEPILWSRDLLQLVTCLLLILSTISIQQRFYQQVHGLRDPFLSTCICDQLL